MDEWKRGLSDVEITKRIWDIVKDDKYLGKELAYYNEENEVISLLDGNLTLTVFENDIIIGFSCELDSAKRIIAIYTYLSGLIHIKDLKIVDEYYISFDENDMPEMLYGHEARMKFLQDKCFNVFKNLLENKNMKDYLEDLNIEDMYKC
jgi:hypothetical protein